jgi:FkbM family methyltransferase
MALSDHDGEIEFFQSDRSGSNQGDSSQGWDYSGSLRPPKEHLAIYPWIAFDRKISVTTATLDSWCNDHGVQAVDFIWMDVQGAEIDVFRGATKTLPKTRFIYTEYSNRELYRGQHNLKQIMSYLTDFEIVIRYPGDVLLANKRFARISSQVD